MTLSFMHYGPIRALVNYNEFIREYNEVKKQTDKAQQDAARTANVSLSSTLRKMNILLTLPPLTVIDSPRCHE